LFNKPNTPSNKLKFPKPEKVLKIDFVKSKKENVKKKHSFREFEIIKARELNLKKDLIVWQ